MPFLLFFRAVALIAVPWTAGRRNRNPAWWLALCFVADGLAFSIGLDAAQWTLFGIVFNLGLLATLQRLPECPPVQRFHLYETRKTPTTRTLVGLIAGAAGVIGIAVAAANVEPKTPRIADPNAHALSVVAAQSVDGMSYERFVELRIERHCPKIGALTLFFEAQVSGGIGDATVSEVRPAIDDSIRGAGSCDPPLSDLVQRATVFVRSDEDTVRTVSQGIGQPEGESFGWYADHAAGRKP